MIDRTTWRGSRRTPRSRPDRTAIAARSSRDRCSFSGGIASRRPDDDRRSTKMKIMARSQRDSGPIVALSRPDRAENHAFFEEKLKLVLRGIEATTQAQGSASTTLENRPHERVNCPCSSGQFPSLKACISLLCSSTFDRLVKKLSEFRGRSLVHRVPPAFRLNSEGIGAGLIKNSSLISSNFPLEFRKSVRKDPSKFTLIRGNWRLILVAIGLVVRFNRLSRGNLSFY